MSSSAAPSRPRILIVLPRWVGDAVMATPLIEALHRAWPAATIDLLLKRYLTGLLAGAPWLGREIIVDDGASFWSLRRALAKPRYDLGVLLPNSFRPALLLAAARVKRRIGYRRNGRAFLLTDGLPFPRQRPFRMIDFYGAIGDRLGVLGARGPLILHASTDQRVAAADLLTSHGLDLARPIVGLNPGAKYGSSKLWPAAHFAVAADALADRTAAQIALLAGPGEDGLAADIASHMTAPAIALPSGEVDLVMLKAVLTHLALLISNDTGPRHMAAALGVPTVTIYGPTHAKWGENEHSAGIDVSIPVDCGPCMQRTCPLGHHRCMTYLSPAMVVDAALKVLATSPRPSKHGERGSPVPIIVDAGARRQAAPAGE